MQVMKMEEQLLIEVEDIATESEMINAAKYINRLYDIGCSDQKLWKELNYIYGEKYYQIFNKYSDKIIANKFINLLMLKYYPCERIIKYELVNSLRKKEDTVLFEMPILDSRIDVCRINGHSYAYEIKTEFDNFKRLEKQIQDYSKVFEYVYVVATLEHYDELIELIPSFCGIKIIRHSQGNRKTTFYSKRKAVKSPNLDPVAQLSCMSKKNLEDMLKQEKVKKIPPSKEGRIEKILLDYSADKINRMFKKAVKRIYEKNWSFVVSHYDEILPIDFQCFFSYPLDPAILYYKDVI